MQTGRAPKAIVIEDVEILPGSWRNFKGKDHRYDPDGVRSFTIRVPDNMIERMVEEGFNVRVREARVEDPDAPPLHYLKIKVNYNGKFPPRVVITRGKKQQSLDEKTVGSLDWQVITYADISINPRLWTSPDGKSGGTSAYLKSLYVTVDEDPLDRKYSLYDDDEPEDDNTPPW